MASFRCCLGGPLVPAGAGRELVIALGSHFMPLLGCGAHEGFQRKRELQFPFQTVSGQLSLLQLRGVVPVLASSTGSHPTFCETVAGCGVALGVPQPTGTRFPLRTAEFTSSCHSGLATLFLGP